jgi:ATP-dependent helicase/nuclease subunit B
VPAAGAAIDPCRPEAVVSPTQLEDAAACPFRYFLRRGLGVDAIESGDRDRDLWIDASLRGSLLHDLYARLLRRCRDAKRKPSVAEDRAWLRDAAAATLANLAQEMPPPSDEIHERESRGFIDDLDLFLEHEIISADKRTPIGLEVAFGGRSRADDGEPLSVGEPVTVVVAGITLRVAGRIDRIDRMADGTFEILDYKTGGFYADAWKGTYAGGRRLQHALYGLAALELLKKTTKKPALGGAEYYFSSVKGGSHRKRIPVQTPARIGRVLSDLRDVLTSGTFVHAPKKDDCKFCDYGSACGARAHERAKPKIRDAALEAYRRLQDHE